jgi:nucleotide-binding universal stress UspA family protein
MTPVGTSADLIEIAAWIDPDVAAEPRNELAGHLHGIAIYLLGELAASADGRTTRDEIDRYDRIARAAADLRAALDGQSSPGRLLGPIAQSISRVAAEKTKRHKSKVESPVATRADALTSNLDATHSICLPGWSDDAHPLAVIERIAKQVAADLVVVGGRGGGNLHARTRKRPETAFGVACGELLAKQLHEPPSISETGKLHDLMTRVWRYATGAEPPPGLGHHAKEAARRIRDKPMA